MSNLKVNTINDASGGSAAVLYGVASPPNSMGFRNRIINGDMRIDQRNNGASVTASATGTYYAVDRTLFFKDNSAAFTLQQSTVAPAGFNKSLIVTVTTAASSTAAQAVVVQQNIEGFNTADLGWGAAGAQSVTMSFFVRSSLTGTYCVAFRNSAFNRSYVAEYTISAANTWEYKTITIPGDTSGTWVADNGVGLRVAFDLGSGSSSTGTGGSWTSTANNRTSNQANFTNTNGATFYITGVQLEAGTVASPFERRDYGRELMMCQRYLPIIVGTGAGDIGMGITTSTSGGLVQYQFKVTPRVPPTGLVTAGSGVFALTTQAAASNVTAVTFNNASNDVSRINITGTGTPYAVGAPCFLYGGSGATIQFTGCEL